MYAVWRAERAHHLRCVSASGHSHAVSMWAWPIAEISWTREPFRCASSGFRIASASSQVARSSSTQMLQKRLSSERSSPGPRLRRARSRRRPRAGGARRSRGARSQARRSKRAISAAVEDHGLERRVRPRERAELAVAGQLDAQVEPLAAGRRARATRRIGPGALGARVQALDGGARRPRASPRCGSPRAGRPARRPTPRARSPRPGTSTSPTAARTARRARRRGSRAASASSGEIAVDRPRDPQRAGIARLRVDQRVDALGRPGRCDRACTGDGAARLAQP